MLVLRALVVALFAASSAAAQTPDPMDWSTAAGYETFTYRDIARTGPPVEASPIAWNTAGPALMLRADRAKPGRLRRWDFTLAFGGRASLAGPLGAVDTGDGDRMIRAGVRYEYRRYLLADHLPSGVDAGLGVQGIGDLMSITRHVPPSIEFGERNLRAGIAWVAAGRLRRWRPFTVEATWVNGVLLARIWQHHSADPAASVSGWGGGWTTDATVRVDVRVSDRASIFVDYLRIGEGLLASHHEYAAETSRWSVGVRRGL